MWTQSAAFGRDQRGALITAEGGDELQRRAREQGYPVLQKPVKPAALRALIAALGKRRGTNQSRQDGTDG